jgi:hypothetical protein
VLHGFKSPPHRGSLSNMRGAPMSDTRERLNPLLIGEVFPTSRISGTSAARGVSIPSSSGKSGWDRRNCQNWVIAKTIELRRPQLFNYQISNYPITKFYPDSRVSAANDNHHNGDVAAVETHIPSSSGNRFQPFVRCARVSSKGVSIPFSSGKSGLG